MCVWRERERGRDRDRDRDKEREEKRGKEGERGGRKSIEGEACPYSDASSYRDGKS